MAFFLWILLSDGIAKNKIKKVFNTFEPQKVNYIFLFSRREFNFDLQLISNLCLDLFSSTYFRIKFYWKFETLFLWSTKHNIRQNRSKADTRSSFSQQRKRKTATCKETTKLMRTMWNAFLSSKCDTAYDVSAWSWARVWHAFETSRQYKSVLQWIKHSFLVNKYNFYTAINSILQIRL